MPVQKRNVAMVYQQFINYPAMTVYENIASPLRVAGKAEAEIDARGAQGRRAAAADALSRPHAAQPLRRPAAAHRARPRHRQECRPRAARRAARQSRLQAARGTARGTAEDLRRVRRDLRLCHDRAVGGAAARRQHRDAVEGPRHPVRPDRRRLPPARDLVTAQTFSDPPLNIARLSTSAAARFTGRRRLDLPVPAACAALPTARYTIGFRPHHLSPRPRPAARRASRRKVADRPRSPARRASSMSTIAGDAG